MKTKLIATLTIILSLSLPAYAGFKPACHDKDKPRKEVVPPPPPTAEEAERVNNLLNNEALTPKQLQKEYKKIMGRAGKKMLREYSKEMRAQHKKLTKAQRQEFMRKTLQNWVDQNKTANAPPGVTYDQYLNDNGNALVIPPDGPTTANIPPANPPAANTPVIPVIPPTTAMQ